MKVFCCNIGFCSVTEAELWGMWHGLNIAWKMGIQKLILEADSQTAITLVLSQISDHHPLRQLVLDIQQILNWDWTVKLRHFRREGNRAADFCAELGYALSEGVTELIIPPQGLKQTLNEDLYGVAWSRMSVG